VAGESDRYLDLSIDELLDTLASPEPAPGSGFVAAVAVAMAAGLVAMAARLSLSDWPEARGAAAQAQSLRARVTPLAETNARAYIEAISALDQPFGSSQPRQPGTESRDEALARKLAKAADVPTQIGRAAADVAALAAAVAENGNPALRADVAVAAALAVAGARGAATLVEVNLATTPGDDRVAQARGYVEDAGAALERALTAVA
jgi:formiminotetrahydrofolate cyclodeaminase